MKNTGFHGKSIWTRWALLVLLLGQSFTFSGFSDIAASRDSGTRSEWLATFSDRRHKTVSYRQAYRSGIPIREKIPFPFEGFRHRQNNRYLTWLTVVCASHADEPNARIPLSAWPRSADEEHRA